MKLLCLHIINIFLTLNLCYAQISDGHDKIDIIHLNVGQGDATIILGPKHQNKRTVVLVDAGEVPSRSHDGGKIVYDELQKYGIAKVDYFINTHHHSDHIGGIAYGWHGTSFVLGPNGVPGDAGDDDQDGFSDWINEDKLKPDKDEIGKGDDIEVLTYVDRGSENVNKTQSYNKYIALAKTSTRIEIDDQQMVDDYQIDLGQGAVMKCLASNGYVIGNSERIKKVDTENERSLCFLLSFNNFNYLIAGDLNGRDYAAENAEIEEAVGQYIFDNEITVEAFQVNHHGANNTSNKDFIYLIKPSVAIISCGNENDHGHPHPEALARLARSSIQYIYQTEYGKPKFAIEEWVRKKQVIANGHIYLTSDGNDFDISTSNSFKVN